MTYANPDSLVTGEWLEANLDDPNLRIIDATYHMPQSEIDAHEEWGFRHIPGAVFFDINEVADKSTGLAHMLSDAETFASALSEMGVSHDHKIVVYDSNGGFMAACRLWWMLRTFGYMNASLLNGGMLRWGKERRPIETEAPKVTPASFNATFNADMLKTKAQILKNITSGESQVLDARNTERFAGTIPEPNPAVPSGNIPGSINVPFTSITAPKNDFKFASAAEINEIFNADGIDMTKHSIVTCGSGVTACVVAFAMHLVGNDNFSVYDGSWSEWATDPEMPVNV